LRFLLRLAALAETGTVLNGRLAYRLVSLAAAGEFSPSPAALDAGKMAGMVVHPVDACRAAVVV
jgi:hypothetical protein